MRGIRSIAVGTAIVVTGGCGVMGLGPGGPEFEDCPSDTRAPFVTDPGKLGDTLIALADETSHSDAGIGPHGERIARRTYTLLHPSELPERWGDTKFVSDFKLFVTLGDLACADEERFRTTVYAQAIIDQIAADSALVELGKPVLDTVAQP